MLSTLPLPRPDELLYSVLARFSWRLQITGGKRLNLILFGTTGVNALCELPRRLDLLRSRIPSIHPLSRANLLQEFTLSPFFAPFLEPRRADALAEVLLSNAGQHRVRRSYATDRKAGFRACPKCVAEDLAYDGEPYWRRVHQVPGVIVCSQHRMFLVETDVAKPAEERQLYRLPPIKLARSPSTELDCRIPAENDLLWLAQTAGWLLGQKDWRVRPEAWQALYQRHLASLRFIDSNSTLRLRALIAELRNRFPPDLLVRLGCDESRGPELIARVGTRLPGLRPPLHHLLFWRFLDLDSQQIQEELAEVEHKLICLAPPEIGFSGRTSGRRYSSEWLQRLHTLWADKSITVCRVAKMLGVDFETVKRQARKLGLVARENESPGQRRVIPRFEIRAQLKVWKTEWLGLRRKYRTKAMSFLRAEKPSLYWALRRHDPVWLAKHTPTRACSGKMRKPSVDWTARDRGFLPLLKSAYGKLVDGSPCPERITAYSLWSKLPVSDLRRQTHRLPRCARFIRRVAESPLAYALRRLPHVASQLRIAGKSVTRTNLCKGASLPPRLCSHPAIVGLVDRLISSGGRHS